MCLDVRNGRKIWKTFAAPARENAPKLSSATLISLRGAPAIAPGAQIVVVGGNDGLLRAFDLGSGAARWQIKLSGTARFAAQLVTFEGDEALLCSGDGPVIFLVSARDGRVVRRWTTPFSVDYRVVASQGMALALDAEGHLQGAFLR
jgi:outer membrane protein assembly factor BamB